MQSLHLPFVHAVYRKLPTHGNERCPPCSPPVCTRPYVASLLSQLRVAFFGSDSGTLQDSSGSNGKQRRQPRTQASRLRRTRRSGRRRNAREAEIDPVAHGDGAAGLADRPSLLLRVRVTTADRAAADRQQCRFVLTLKHQSRMGLIQRASGQRCQIRPTPSPLRRAERGPCARGQRRWRQRSGLSGTARHR
jgi:hypothetical protein